MTASRVERRSLYGEVYDELYAAYPGLDGAEDSSVSAARLRAQLAIVKPFVRRGSDVAEIGSGSGQLAEALAGLGASVTALDVSARGSSAEVSGGGVRWVRYDGLELPLPSASQDAIVSLQTVEHLHPEDAAFLVSEARRCLRPEGVFVCTTPHRLLGPHDVSRHFTTRAEGLHLHEYTVRELHSGLLAIGFADVRVLVGWRTRYVSVPARAVELVEARLVCLPRGVVQRPVVRRVLTGLLGIRLAARKAR
jgi:SAM-dependent methyltransferase